MSANCCNTGNLPKDASFTSLVVNNTGSICRLRSECAVVGTLTAESITTNSLNLREVITLIEQDGPTGTYFLAPTGPRTIYRFSAPISTNTTINFSVDSSQNQVGDEMTWLLVNDIVGSSITLNVPNPGSVPPGPYYVLACGGLTSTILVTAAVMGPPFVPGRIAQHFMYDGEVWVQTGDNC